MKHLNAWKYHFLRYERQFKVVYMNKWLLFTITKHWLDNKVQIKKSKFSLNILLFFDPCCAIKSIFVIIRRHNLFQIITSDCLVNIYNNFSIHWNVLSKHLLFWYCTWIKLIVRYKIIFIFVKYWIFLKKYKISGPKYKERLPCNAPEGLTIVMWL